MNLKKVIYLVSATSLLLLAFQNCGVANPGVLFSSEANKAESGSTDSGQSYDGKIYVLLGEFCTDGTQVQSKIILGKSGSAQLVRENCQNISAITLAAADFQISPQNPNELIYKTLVFTAAVAEPIGAGYGTLPKLVSPVDPTAYGAVGDGVTDNTQAFVSALNAGDLLIPSGNYVIRGTILVPAGRAIQCASLSSVKLINPTLTTQSNLSSFRFIGKGGSLSNCRMTGAEAYNANGSAIFDQNAQYNYLVSVVDYFGAVGNIQIINNIFENCHGNACLSIYGGTSAADANLVQANTFRNCGYHAVVIDGGTNNRVASNSFTDCSLAVQNDNAGQANLNNILEDNYLTVTHGNGRGAPYLTGGTVQNFDYTSNLVRNNKIVGNGTAGSINILTAAPRPAQYLNNSCTNGCAVH